MRPAEDSRSQPPLTGQQATRIGPDNEMLSRDAFLDGAVWIWQPKNGYRAGIDAVFLAASAQPKAGEPALKILDAGAGVGTVGLLAAKRLEKINDVQVTLLERSDALAALAQRNVSENNLSQCVQVAQADFLGPSAALEAVGVARASFDLVLANPPFHIDTHGTLPGDAIKAGANAMGLGDLDRWARAMAHVTTPGGQVILIHKAEALEPLLASLAPRFGALRILPLHPREGDPASRIIITGVKGSRAPLRLLAGHILHGDGHGFTPATRMILREGASLCL